MTFDEFAIWLEKNPNEWISDEDVLKPREERADDVCIPLRYLEFLDRFGPLSLFNGRVVLMGHNKIASATNFIRQMAAPGIGITLDHLVPFCDQMSNDWYYCFDGEKIVDFDALEPFLIEKTVAPNFEAFLDEIILERRLP